MSLILDLLSTLSVIGIWPRFIEPRRVSVTRLHWDLSPSHISLDGFKILHLSDLHFHKGVPDYFLDKIVRRANRLKPDLIVFTGDFICYSQLEDRERLKKFLCRLKAPAGSFCTFGNHDYERYVSRNSEGEYDVVSTPSPLVGIARGVRSLFSKPSFKTKVTPKAQSLSFNADLCNLLKETPFTLLENTTTTLSNGLNITGLGDLALGRFRPETAFAGYNHRCPGIVLSHNPDTFVKLTSFPGDWILSGHTHGEQIHLPYPKWARSMTRKLARLEHSAYTRGMHTKDSKTLYVNRGLGCHKPFRLFSAPELCLITLQTPKT